MVGSIGFGRSRSFAKLVPRMESEMTLYTLGYEGLDIMSFVAMIKRHKVSTVVDVRERAQSRKAGFSKGALSEALRVAKIDYTHMPSLGCPKPVRDQYRKDGCWQMYTKGFMAYLETAEQAVAELAAYAQEASCVLICYEADFNYCHRSMVAQAVQNITGMAIKHLDRRLPRTIYPEGYPRQVSVGI